MFGLPGEDTCNRWVNIQVNKGFFSVQCRLIFVVPSGRWTAQGKEGQNWMSNVHVFIVTPAVKHLEGVAQWVARLTHDRWIPVSCEFEHHQRPLLFHWARNLTLIASYWLVPGTDLSMIYLSKKLLVSQSN